LGLIYFLWVVPALGQVSTNVPVDDCAYRDLEKVIAQGLIKSDLWGTRPMSRFEMARLVQEARESWEWLTLEERQNLGLIREILLRLEKRFREDIDEVMGFQKTVSTFVKPAERVTAYYRYQNHAHSTFNNEGIDYYDGGNAVVDLTMRARIASYLGLYAQPRFVNYQNSEDLRDVKGNKVEETSTDSQKHYAKLDIYNWEIQYGVDSLWWNPSHHGALIMSNNAEPFQMVKLSNPLPTMLPLGLDFLGLLKFNFIFTTLDSNRLNPRPGQEQLLNERNEPYLFGLHLDFKPRPWLEFGLNHLSIYGGEGRGGLSTHDHLRVMFRNENLTGQLSANSQSSAFFLIRWYHFSNFLSISETLSLYGELGGEDEGYPPDNRAFQLGILLGDFLKRNGRLQLRLEYANTTPFKDELKTVWYSHGEYPATYEGRIFGHHVGSNAEDIFARLGILLNPKLEIGLQGDYERHGTSLEAEERVLQGQIDVLYRPKNDFSIIGCAGMEHVENLGFIKGSDDDCMFLSLRLRYYF
jgi:hypothetical protein